MFSFLGLLNNNFNGSQGMNALSPANHFGRDFGQAFNNPMKNVASQVAGFTGQQPNQPTKHPGLGPLEFLTGNAPW